MTLRSSLIAIVVCACACRQSNDGLRDRILAAHASLHCPIDCVSPHVLAMENGYTVTSFLDGKPIHDQVRPDDLARYLSALPTKAWPNGPDVIVSPADDAIDFRLVEEHFLTHSGSAGPLV